MRTRVGYCGGKTANPTYQSIGDHAETIQIDFDPQLTSYAKLLEVFWSEHNPTREMYSRQYMSAIFTADEEQLALATASKAARERQSGKTMHTEIAPLGIFTRAEDYHQKYRLRRSATLTSALIQHFGHELGFVDSSPAMWINAFLAHEMSEEQLRSRMSAPELKDLLRQALALR